MENENEDEFKLALNKTGFIICSFEPDPLNYCERCKTVNVQLYYRRAGYYVEEGEYFCEECIINKYKNILNEIREFENGEI